MGKWLKMIETFFENIGEDGLKILDLVRKPQRFLDHFFPEVQEVVDPHNVFTLFGLDLPRETHGHSSHYQMYGERWERRAAY